MEDKKTPSHTFFKISLSFTPSNLPAMVPEYAPVPGRGIATKRTNPIAAYFSTNGFALSLILLNKARAKTTLYFSKRDNKKSKNSNTTGTIKTLAVVQKNQTKKGSKECIIPRGIVNLNSK